MKVMADTHKMDLNHSSIQEMFQFSKWEVIFIETINKFIFNE